MKPSIKSIAAFFAAISFWVAIAQTASAANTTVIVGAGGLDRFSPTNVTISVNDSVIWNWTNIFHTSTSGTNGVHGEDNGVTNGLWDTGLVETMPFLFTNTFTSAGAFAYYCSVHFSFGMTGQVLVASSSLLPPSIGITSPLDGTVFSAPANVAIQAGVTNGSGAVTNVQFLMDSAVLANESAGPFSTTTSDLAAGDYTLSAIALDNNGLSATNSVDISVVTPVTVLLTNDFRPSGSSFEFSYPANVGLTYVVQRSGDAINWSSLATNKAASNPVVFDDVNATNGFDFYRVVLLPNP
jgi:plastocyanin